MHGAQQPTQLKSQVAHEIAQQIPQLPKHPTSQERAQAIESNALVHP
jgi:hypothetical protein